MTTIAYPTEARSTYAQTKVVTDLSSKVKRTAPDALGRVTAVIEDATASGSALLTQYGYLMKSAGS